MRVLLVHPDFPREVSDRDEYLRIQYPSWIMNYLASTLKVKGVETECVDSLYAYLASGCPEKYNMIDFVISKLEKGRYDMLGMTMYSPTRKLCLDLARRCRKVSPGTKIMIGGPYPTVMHSQLAKNHAGLIDYIFVGSAERSLPKLARVNMDAAGRGEGPRIYTDNPVPDTLDGLPLADYSPYLRVHPHGRLPTAYIMTSRGCDNHCRFCANLSSRAIHRRTDDVIREVDALVLKYGMEKLIIYDDTFGSPGSNAAEILKEIKRLGHSLVITAMSRFDNVTPEFVRLFRQAGGVSLTLGVETGSERLRNLLGKKLTDRVIYSAAEAIRAEGISLGIFLMFGIPGETDEDVRASLEMTRKLDPEQVFCNVLNIKPGDSFFREGVGRGTLKEEDWLDEDRRLFTFLDAEKLEYAIGNVLLFDRMFTTTRHKPSFEATQWIDPADEATRERLLSLAERRLGPL
jgi:anaerobic magnesium-protoporphyrin IX monomethyl ester cyclase